MKADVRIQRYRPKWMSPEDWAFSILLSQEVVRRMQRAKGLCVPAAPVPYPPVKPEDKGR